MKGTFGEINQEQVSETKLRALRQGTAVQSSPIPTKPPPNHLFLAFTLSSTNSNMLTTPVDQQIQQPSAPITATPVQQRPTSDDMDIDFARRGPLTSSNDNRGLVKDSALFAVSQDTSKPLVLSPTLASDPQRQVQAIEMEGHSIEVSGNDLGRL
ncbi:hypothetical protein BASA61_000528 [Batrachochytrium salamandrivorans]|nr:hypothetical protein BASA61_000528 [Batrachochytrium salamandrivorans]